MTSALPLYNNCYLELQIASVRADQERRVRYRREGVRERLTPFERHLLKLMASGLKRKEIARAVNKSPQTVSNSMTLAKDKLGARSLAEAAVRVGRANPGNDVQSTSKDNVVSP